MGLVVQIFWKVPICGRLLQQIKLIMDHIEPTYTTLNPRRPLWSIHCLKINQGSLYYQKVKHWGDFLPLLRMQGGKMGSLSALEYPPSNLLLTFSWKLHEMLPFKLSTSPKKLKWFFIESGCNNRIWSSPTLLKQGGLWAISAYFLLVLDLNYVFLLITLVTDLVYLCQGHLLFSIHK